MKLILTITGVDRLDNGEAAQLRLDRHGAMIGRSPHMDWSLPDPASYISSSHCEIQFQGGAYILIDRSTNGTFVNRATAKLAGPHRIADGDVIQIGHYELVARVQEDGAAPPSAPPPTPEWGGWSQHVPAEPVGVDPARWDRPVPQAAITGQGPASQAWAAPKVASPSAASWGQPPAPSAAPGWGAPAAPAPPPGPSAWEKPSAPAAAPSAWSSEPRAAAPPSASDVWGQLAGGNQVDWARGGFGVAIPSYEPPPVPAAPPSAHGWQPALHAPQPGGSGQEWNAFLTGAGLQPSDVKGSPTEVLAAAGALLTRLVGGLVVMMEARARAKAQLGAQSTSLEFDGNNPLKFARSADRAVAQLLSPPERGFMAADRAVEDAFRDLQAHQLATLQAMQGALADTLERFSPAAIRARAEKRGLLAKILPGTSSATLWQAYEREFEGVTADSDEAFMDVFAKEFRDAYERVSAEMKGKH